MLLRTALATSVAFHASLLLIGDTQPNSRVRDVADRGIDVVLVNAQSDERPNIAQAIAQVDLAGGGEAQQAIAQSPDKPQPRKQSGTADAKPGADDAAAPKGASAAKISLAQLAVQERTLLTTLKRSLIETRLPAPTIDSVDEAGTEQAANARAERLQMLAHIAKLENAILESNQRPKRRFISPATQAAVYARYFDAMRDHIEAVGTQRFPSVNGARQYGTLVMAITVNHDGRVLDRQILQAASNSVLNLHALALLDAMRFKSFDTALRASADELTVITRFNFLQDQTVSATLQAPK